MVVARAAAVRVVRWVIPRVAVAVTKVAPVVAVLLVRVGSVQLLHSLHRKSVVLMMTFRSRVRGAA
jgi:hypothetical protein